LTGLTPHRGFRDFHSRRMPRAGVHSGIVGRTSQESEELVGESFYLSSLEQIKVRIDPSGAIVEVEEQVALESLPAAVKDGLQTKAGEGKLVKVESITKHDKLVAYEAKVLTAAKKSENSGRTGRKTSRPRGVNP
jgi:hypothetical protein